MDMLDELTIYGPVDGPTGYDEVTRNLILGMYFMGRRVKLQPFQGWSNSKINTGIEGLVTKLTEAQVNSKFRISVCLPAQVDLSRSMVNINYTMFEADRICPSWVDASQLIDHIIVPTEFNRDTWLNSGVSPRKVDVVPIGIDTFRHKPNVDILNIYDKDGASLHEKYDIRVMNVQEVTTRKNLTNLLKVWVETVTKEDNACLILKLGSFSGDGFRDFYEKFINTLPKELRENAAPVFVITRTLPEILMPSFYANGTHYFSMSRGEGWGLPETKAGAAGQLVVAPRSTGYTGYLSDKNSYPITCTPIPAAMDSFAHIKYLYHGANWFEPEVEAAKQQLRLAIEDYKSKNLKRGETLATRIAEKHDLISFAKNVLTSIEKSVIPPAIHVRAPKGDKKEVNLCMVCKSASKERCGIGDYTVNLYNAFQEGVMKMLLVGSDVGYMKEIDANTVDIMHMQLEYQFITPVRLRHMLVQCRRRDILSCVTMHTVHNKAPQEYHEALVDYADKVIVHSDVAADALQDCGVPTDKIAILPMGIPTPVFDNIYTDGKKKFAISFFGFSYFHKGIDILLRAFNILHKKQPDRYLLRIYSNKPQQDQAGYYEQCHNLMGALGLVDNDAVKWIDQFLPEETLCRYLSTSNLIVLPYDEHGGIGTSAAVRTCLRAGTPIMLNNEVSFFQDLPENLYHPTCRDPEKLAADIENYANNIHSKESVDEYKKVRDGYVANCSWDKVAELHKELYINMVNQHNKDVK